MLLGENGIINKAREAGEDYAIAGEEEREGLSEIEEYINVELTGNYTKVGEIVEGIQQHSITIPKGYAVAEIGEIGTENEGKIVRLKEANEWESYLTQENINKGIVITDGTNEFVWVPVDDINSMAMCSLHGTETLSSNLQCPTCLNNTKLVGKLYWDEDNWCWSNTPLTTYDANSGLREPAYLTQEEYGDASTTENRGINLLTSIIGLTGTNAEILRNWENMLQRDFNSMIESVEKYKGFYIGRYETSLEGTTARTVRIADAMVADEINWYNMYIYQKGIETDSVQSSMIWGSQWDQTLKWLVASGAKRNADLIISTNWGNHLDSMSPANVRGFGEEQKTGFSEYWKANNIYDLAGNVGEWTIEAYGTLRRVARGRRVRLRWR